MKDHHHSCPRAQFWDAGYTECPCTCPRGWPRKTDPAYYYLEVPIISPDIPIDCESLDDLMSPIVWMTREEILAKVEE